MDAHAYWTVPLFLQEKVLKNDGKNTLICENAVVSAKYGSCALTFMCSWSARQAIEQEG